MEHRPPPHEVDRGVGEVAIDAMKPFVEGSTADDVFRHLGPPALVGTSAAVLRRPRDHDFPTPDAPAHEWRQNGVWVYHHRRRGRVALRQPMRTILSLRDGIIVGSQREDWKPRAG